MARTALLTFALSAAAVVAYLGYRGLTLVPVSEIERVGAPSELVDTLPDFSLTDINGDPRSIQSWPDKALVINFWATWCAPCLREIPILKAFQAAHAEQPVQVVGIAVDRLEPVRRFAEDMEFNYPVLVGESDAMNAAASFGVDFFALPFTVFTGPGGGVLGVHTGELHAEDLENLGSVITDLAAGTTDLAAARARIAGRR